MTIHFGNKNKNNKFSNLILPYLGQIKRLAFRLTGNTHDAEDLIQEFLIKIYPHKASLDLSNKSRSWITKVIYNTYIDLWRKKRNSPLELAESYCISERSDEIDEFNAHVCTTLNPQTLISLSQSQRQLTEFLFLLSNEHRIVITMHDIEGYTLPELTEIINTPLGTLKSRLHRGREKLRNIIIEQNKNNPNLELENQEIVNRGIEGQYYEM